MGVESAMLSGRLKIEDCGGWAVIVGQILTLTLFLEDELALVADVVLSATTVLTTLSFVLGHDVSVLLVCEVVETVWWRRS